MIDGDRLWRRIEELGGIGRTENGGVARLSFTEEERAAKDLVSGWMEGAGLTVREDAVGNLIGRREGTDPDAPPVLMGSHVDSVYDGGDFDGPLGVIAGIEVLQSMQDEDVQTTHPIEVVAFTDEEGARFSFGMIGSRAMAGVLSEEQLGNTDAGGTSIAEAMRKAGFDPQRMREAARVDGAIGAYVELHIEQGKVLEGEDLPVGVVTGIAGPAWFRMTFEGETGHAGTSPMNGRRDALAAAAEVMGVIEEEAARTGSSVGTVGQLDAEPGGINIIPGRVTLSLDLRDIDEATRDGVEERIMDRAAEICDRRGIDLDVEVLQRLAPAPCSDLVRDAAIAACEELGIRARLLPSGAGHDGMNLAAVAPFGMVFVRSRDGISHNPAEWSSREDCATGAEALYRTVLRLAEQS
jgi:allantoate deiminase